MTKRLVRASIRLGLRHDRVRRLVAAELAASRPLPIPAPVAESTGETGLFVDGLGASHPLDPTLRDKLKPGWRTMFDPVASAAVPTDERLHAGASKAEKVVDEASRLTATIAGVPLGGTILEIGCYDGSAAFQLARREGSQVIASDLARYYVDQRPGGSSEADVESQQVALAELRERARHIAGVAVDRVTFVEDDIASSALEPASFDAIVSFEVLEHVQEPAAAFASMTRLLKPGAIAYHDYNPFFSLIGGHSLCTLDFPWGHARLDPTDFERYLREVRPTELSQALRFYRESLNRVTLEGLRAAIASAGLELLALIPWFDRALLPQVTPDVLAEVRRTYPTAGVEDLLATFVAVVVRRPPDAKAEARSWDAGPSRRAGAMTDPVIAVRPAAATDSERLLAWANDPITRAAGFHTEPISAEEHRAWLRRVLADPQRRIWIGLEGSREIGVVRVALTPDGSLDVGIALDGAARGAGRALPLLEAGLAAARAAFPGRHFRAWIRAANVPSLALFRGAGFEPPATRPAAPPGAPPDAIVLERD